MYIVVVIAVVSSLLSTSKKSKLTLQSFGFGHYFEYLILQRNYGGMNSERLGQIQPKLISKSFKVYFTQVKN